jgi:hypothetical protein
MPPVRLAVSLHCATDEERSALLPANSRYGGLDELMAAIKDYQEKAGSRVTLEWALIEGKNDSISVARTLGRLITRHGLRRDMVHVNVIPLNPTGGYGGSPSGRQSVNLFCQTVEQEFKVRATPRMRRGIDIDAGCGQLKSKVEKRQSAELRELLEFATPSTDTTKEKTVETIHKNNSPSNVVSFVIDEDAVDVDEDDFDDPEYSSDIDQQEAQRLINLVKDSTIHLSKS